jgi:FkbM family methyltransferase
MKKTVKRIRKIIEAIIKRITIRVLSFLNTYLKFDIISIASNTINKRHFYQVNINKIKSILKSEKIVFFDIGARGGINKDLAKYRDVLDVYVSDTDASESVKLSNEEGFHVINKGIGQKSEDEVDLYLCKKPAVSSVLRPNGRFLKYFTHGHLSRFEVINKEKVSTTNISSIFKYRDCLDLLKIDVQGYELEVIKGLGEVRPLIIESEVSYVPLYQDSATFFELGKELYDMGYIMFHSSFRCIQSPILLPFTKKHVNQIPVHGDAWFIPDWTRKKGIDIIKHREKKWKAIMLLYGMESIFDYAISEIKNT